MKRTFKSIMFVAAAAMAFTACNIEPVETPEVTTGTHTVKFIASQVDTKTTMEINDGVASFAWEGTDQEYFHIFENEVGATFIDAKRDNGVMAITAVFPDSTAPYTYTGFMAATVSNDNPAVSNEQNDFGAYDPESDILVAKPVTDNAPKDIDGFLFQFKRVVAINQMTLKGLAAGETVTDVTITSDKPIAGEYDFANGAWTASETSIAITTTRAEANTEGQAVVYFVSAPVEEAQLTVTATTAAGKTYTKELAKTISFTEGGVKTFGVTVDEVVPAYVKVTSTADLTDGQYLIVCEDQNVAFNGALETLDAVSNTVGVSISDGKIASSKAIDAAAFTFTAKDGSFLSGSGKYIGNSANSNALNTSTSLLSNSVSITDGDADIIAAGGAYLRYNASSGQTRFRYFKSSTYSGQKAIQLYKFNGSTTPTPVVTLTSIAVKTAPVKVSYTEGEKFDPTGLVITKTMSDASTEDVAYAGHENEFSFNPSLETALTTNDAIVTISYGSKTATCEVTVNAAAYDDDDSYTLVTDLSTLKAGDVIVLGCAEKSKAAGAMGSNAYFASVDAIISDGKLVSKDAIEITIGGTKDAWTLTTSEGTVGTTAAKKLCLDKGTTTWKFIDGKISSTTETYGWIQYNASSPRFLNYGSSQTAIEVYKK